MEYKGYYKGGCIKNIDEKRKQIDSWEKLWLRDNSNSMEVCYDNDALGTL